MPKQRKTADSPANLTRYFGDNHLSAEHVLDTINREPARLWRAEDLLEASGVDSMMELLVIVSRLTYLEMIAHPDPGVYAAGGVEATGRARRSA